MGAFVVAVNAVTPFLVYLCLGWLSRRSALVKEAFLQEMNQFVFRCFFPITMFYNTHAIQVSISESSRLITVCAGLLASIFIISLFVVPLFVKENARRGVVIQCLTRSNLVLFALGLTETLFGAEGVALASIIVAIFVPLYNVLAIIVLEYYRGGANSPRKLLRRVITNPLLLGGLAGLMFSFLSLQLPGALESAVSKLSSATTPLAMIILGGTIHVSGVMRDLRTIVATLATKMLALPTVAVVVCMLLGMTQLETFVCFTMYATPIAASAYTMSQNMGGDGELAGELVAISTVVSMVTLFAWIYLLRSVGIV